VARKAEFDVVDVWGRTFLEQRQQLMLRAIEAAPASRGNVAIFCGGGNHVDLRRPEAGMCCFRKSLDQMQLSSSSP
jgi:hypothetical protein